jgi:hypothetical protein
VTERAYSECVADEVLKKIERLSVELDEAQKASKKTLKEVQKAKRSAEKAKRAVRVQEQPKYATRKRSKQR